jgi:transglutaminase-like putative cysteine protease
MRIHIEHKTTYYYAAPPKLAIQHLRLTPRGYDGQHIVNWRIDVDIESHLREGRDSFGNTLHRMTIEGPVNTITTHVEGNVITYDTSGVVSGTNEILPIISYLRETALTEPTKEIREFALESTAKTPKILDKCHRLLMAINETMVFDQDSTQTNTTAKEAFLIRKGVCQDFSHIFIACARTLEIPTRYVSGYFLRNDTDQQVAGHAWAEAYISDLGWIGFDPTHGISPDERYVRVATALDYYGAAPIRGAHIGGEGEEMNISMRVLSPDHAFKTTQHLNQ